MCSISHLERKEGACARALLDRAMLTSFSSCVMLIQSICRGCPDDEDEGCCAYVGGLNAEERAGG